jgi:hypothetical protein
MFSFGNTAGTSQSTAKSRLKGNEIHEVQLDGCEVQDIVGVKDSTQTYKVLKIKFSNEDGNFEHTVFEPKPDDFKRGESNFTNKNGNTEKIPQPSNVESMMLLFKHIIDGFVPEVASQIDRKEKELTAPNWDKLRALVTAILEKGKGRTNKIKLIKDKDGNGKFPGFFAGVSREGTVYVRNNFVGTKVAFSPYEMTKINGEANSTPTAAKSYNTPSFEETVDTSLDLNFDLDGI